LSLTAASAILIARALPKKRLGKEENTYVAYCPELDISSCGSDVQHAKEMLKTAVRLFVEEAEKLEEF
jgi:predicted RNase H-like HicB family nuclease